MAQNQRKKKQKKAGASSARDNGNLKVIMYIVLVVVGIAGAVSLGTAGGSTKPASNRHSDGIAGRHSTASHARRIVC